MRHRRAGYRLGRTTAHRTSTLRHIAYGLFEHGQVVTTLPKAKAVQPMVEKIITLAKQGDVHARRLVIPHPVPGEPKIDVTAPLPDHMRRTWDLLGLDPARFDADAEE